MEKAPDAFRIISEVADELDVPQHVLRFWESRFSQIRPMKRGGGRRYYRPDDIDLLRGIRHLLYSEGYTIRGVQRLLREQGIGFVQTVWQEDDSAPASNASMTGGHAEDGGVHPRERLLLNLLPGFRKSREFLSGGPNDDPAASQDAEQAFQDEPEEDESLAREPSPSLRPASGSSQFGAALAQEQVERLQTALDELGECRRLIDEALALRTE